MCAKHAYADDADADADAVAQANFITLLFRVTL